MLVKVSLTIVFATTFCWGSETPAPAAAAPTPTPVPARSVVVRTESSDAIYDYKTNNSVVYLLVNDALTAATGDSASAAQLAALHHPVAGD